MRPTHALTATALLLAAAVAAVACSAPPSEEDVQAGEGAATGTTTDPDGAYADIPATENAFVCEADAAGKLTPKPYVIRDDEPVTKPADQDFANAMDVAIAAPFNAKTYIASRPTKQRKFAAATVLAGMRRMRRYYFNKSYRAGGVSVSAIGAHPASTAGSCQPSFNGPFDSCQYTYNESNDGSTGGNMGAMPAFWSDVQAHFYTMAPHFRHACWTAGQLYAGLKAPLGTTPPGCDATSNIRQTISDFCSGKPVKCGKWDQAMPNLTANLSAYNIMWMDPKSQKFIAVPEDVRTDVPPATLASTPADVPKIKGAEFAAAQRKAGYVNVWDYIMLGSLFAFDFEQQQAVLNAFYADDKKASGDATPFNPCEVKDCGTWRAKRRADSDPQDGTHCRSDKTLSAAVKSGGPWQ